MLISRQHKFLFVHICKTAGTSITEALAPFADELPNDRISRLRSKARLVSNRSDFYLPKHADTHFAEQRLSAETFHSLFKFAFVRNPWDLLVSSYHYIQGRSDHHRRAKVRELDSFDAFVDYEIRRDKLHQHKWIYSSDGTLLVDFVGRFENLQQDFSTICSRIGIITKLPHTNASPRSLYAKYYTPSLREKVAYHWSRDIALFGYQFEDNSQSGPPYLNPQPIRQSHGFAKP